MIEPASNTRRPRDPTEARAVGMLSTLRRLARALDLYSRQLGLQHGVTVPQLLCLRALERLGPTTAGRLAVEAGMSQPTVTGILDRLEKKALIARQRQPDDKRRVWIELEAAGRAFLAEAPPVMEEAFTARLRELPEANQRILDVVLQQLVGLVEGHPTPE